MLSAVNINDNKIAFSDYRLISEDAFQVEDKRTRITSGDVLLTIVGAIGRVAVVQETTPRFTLQRSVAVITPLHVVPKFLMYQLGAPSVAQYFKNNARGTAQKGVYLKTLGQTEIHLPPLNEQHRIVAKIEELFSELDKGIENLKTAREQLKVYRQALLKHAFEGKLTVQWREQNRDKLETAAALLARIQIEREQRYQQQLKHWQTTGGSKPKAPKSLPPLTAEELAELPAWPEGWGWIRFGELFADSPQNGIYKPANYYGAGCHIIRIDDFYDGHLIKIDGFKRVTLAASEIDSYKVNEGDLLVNRVNSIEYLGKCCEVKAMGEPIVFESNIMKISLLKSFAANVFVTSYLSSYFGKSKLCANAKHAVNQASINQTDVSVTPVPMCSLAEQVQISNELASKLSEVDQLDQTITASLQQAEALRQSILKKAFSGQLVAQDANDEPAAALLARIRAETMRHAEKSKKPISRSKRNE